MAKVTKVQQEEEQEEGRASAGNKAKRDKKKQVKKEEDNFNKVDFSTYLQATTRHCPRRRLNILERMILASQQGRGRVALQMLLHYLDNPRLLGHEEMDAESVARLAEIYVVPLVARDAHHRDRVLGRIRDVFRDRDMNHRRRSFR